MYARGNLFGVTQQADARTANDKEVDSPVSNQNAVETKTDVVLVGAGIMSATLGALLRQLQPDWSISTFERLDAVAAESSDPWNNAGTGHSAV